MAAAGSTPTRTTGGRPGAPPRHTEPEGAPPGAPPRGASATVAMASEATTTASTRGTAPEPATTAASKVTFLATAPTFHRGTEIFREKNETLENGKALIEREL